MKRAACACTILVLGAPAGADDRLGVSSDEPAPPTATLVEPTAADLRVQRAPVQLKMRPKTVAQSTAAEASEPAVRSFSPVPRSMRDLRERVTFNIRAGVAIDSGPASGEALRGGAQLPDGYSDSRPWILGDAMVAARDLLLPSLGAYFLSSFQLDASDSLATRAWSVNYSDASEGQQLAIKAGYAEWGRDDRKPDQRAWVRAGRQFRLDGGALFAYFDGVTGGYRAPGWNGSAFVGRRVALYVDTPAGVTFGATAALDLKSLADLPARASVDYMGLAIDAFDASVTRHLAVLNASYDVSRTATATARARMVDSGDGSFELGRVGARVKVQPSRNLLVLGDVEHRRGGDLAYDLAAPSAVDITQIANQLGVGLAAPIDATTIGARVDYRKKDTELLVFGRAELPSDAAAATTVDQRGWYELGAALAGSPIGIRGRGVWVTAQYTLRQYQDPDKSDEMGSAFGDASTSGLDRLHELAAEATLASGGTGMRWRFAAGAFYRVYDFATPYVTIANEGRAGGRGDLSVWFTKAVRGELAAELAEASPVLARELGTLSSVRVAMEARW